MNNQIEHEKIINEANEMLNGIYCFNGVWDMEPCSIPINNKKTNWNIKYNDDIEWTYMFTRMDYLYKFIISSDITKDIKYINHGFKIINKWFHDNSKYISKLGKINRKLFNKNNSGYRTLDISIMISNITDYIIYCKNKNYINEKEFNNYKNKIIKVINYLIPRTDGDFKSYSNWGIIENGNILYTLNRLNIKNNNEIISERLIRHVNNQINNNGYQIESSPMYLVEILLVLLKVIKYNFKIKDKLLKPVLLGCDYIASIRKNDNTIPNIGDSDLTNISDLMIIVSNITKEDKYLKYINRNIDLEYAYKYDIKIKNYKEEKISKEIINYNNQSIYRDKDIYLLCTNTNRRVNGHKHYDYLSILFSINNKDILVDLGRYSYKNDDNRKFFVGPQAHNTINLLNDKYYNYVTQFVVNEKIECKDNIVINNKYNTIRMSCIFGYNDITISRYVTYINNIGLIVTDILDKKIDHETYFNLGEDYDINYINDLNISSNIKEVKYSKKYNEYINTKQIYIKTDKEKLTHFFLLKDKDIKVKYNKDNLEYLIDKDKINIPL